MWNRERDVSDLNSAPLTMILFNPLTLDLGIQIEAHHLSKMWIFYEPKKMHVMKYTTFCREINWDALASLKKYNEIKII